MSKIETNRLYFGDNLLFLRNPDYFPSESVDLVYLDPPFNSSQDYNLLYKETAGVPSSAQIKAFKDTWKWDESAARALHDLNTFDSTATRSVVQLMNTFEEFLGHSPMFAYLLMMSVRLVELRRILKPTGAIFLHCDPTASHYLKLVMDGIFGAINFKNEIIWQKIRTEKAQSKHFSRLHDTILFYARSSEFVFNGAYVALKEEYLDKYYSQTEVETGRRFQLISFLQGGQGPARRFGDRLIEPPVGRHWIWTQERIDEAMHENLLVFTHPDRPRLKKYLEKSSDRQIGTIWSDIYPVNSVAQERLGYNTQKPKALLERIINAASRPGDIILDPFCGCGTMIDAVVSLNLNAQGEPPREWIGIDITHLAIDLIKSRLAQRFGLGRGDYTVIGEPTTLAEARALALEDRYQFQYWALGLIGARPWGDEKKKGKDRGIDGYRMYLHGHQRAYRKCIIQVKSGKVNSSHIRDLKGAMEREGADLAALITLEKETTEMKAEALAGGYYHSEVMNRDYPRVQILSIEQLLSDPDTFKFPPGGDYSRVTRFQSKTKSQNGLF
jgi:site-specific DNA-methyltransferase (adenine-specific)